MNLLALMMIAAVSAQQLRSEYPDADTVVVDEVERVEYFSDGTSDTTTEEWVKVLTEKGRRESSVTRLDYSRRYGTGDIVYVGAIDENGVEREIDVSATKKDATDNSSMSANIYDPLDRVITCTIPGLKIGETVHIKKHHKMERPRCQNKWADLSVMEWKQPILKTTYEIVAPKELPLKKIAIRNPLGNITSNVVTRADGKTVWSFVAEKSAQVFPEPDMPPLFTQVQNVRVSTAENWQEISKWYWELSLPHLVKTNEAMVAKARELKSVRSIFKFVSQEVRYMGLTMEDTSPGYAPHDVNITFDNRYGVCRDKAGLLVAMLRSAGFEAFPVLIQVGAKLDKEVPQPFFNHAIVAVEDSKAANDESGKYLLMDPTNENTQDLLPSYLSNCSYIVCRPEGEELMTTPVVSPNANRLSIRSEGTMSKEGSLFLETKIEMNGINDTAYRGAMARRTPEDRVKFVEKVVKEIAAGAELIRCEIKPEDMRDTEKEVTISLAVKFPETILNGDTMDAVNLPFYSRVFGVANFLLSGNTSLVTRKYMLRLTTTAAVDEEMKIDLAGTVGETKSLPPDETIGKGCRYSRSFTVTNGTLRAKRELVIKAVEFCPKEYTELREEIKDIEAAERKRPIFAKDLYADASVRYIVDSTEVDIVSDREWTNRATIVKQVLDYKGKKSSAELKFSYNPTWEDMKIVSAVVSNLDGRVYALKTNEVSVMDASWAATAPRYPASKIMIANLPSVEIGSVISYEVVSTVTNSPLPFYGIYNFDSQLPNELIRVRINDFKREVRNPKRLPNEANQPAACNWRDMLVVSSNRFHKIDLGKLQVPAALSMKGKSIKEIRDWMAKYVKIAGPSMYELTLKRQLTEPEIVLKERYATRLDYIRTMVALMRSAGFEADVVLAAGNGDDDEESRRRDKYEKPDVSEFDTALCRIRFYEGGWFGIGGKTREIFVGTENQYAELGTCGLEGSDYFDPSTGEFGIVGVEPKMSGKMDLKQVITVREDGAVDIDDEVTIRGADVATFRKTYSEILPEERSRRFQRILGDISEAATATRELETDTESYPAVRKFSCYVPDYATIDGDAITLQLPMMISSIASYNGLVRRTPVAVNSSNNQSERIIVRFPRGYTEIDHLPEGFSFADPKDASKVWMVSKTTSRVVDGALEVEVLREVFKRHECWYQPTYFELFKDWDRIAKSKSNRTIVVRKAVR